MLSTIALRRRAGRRSSIRQIRSFPGASRRGRSKPQEGVEGGEDRGEHDGVDEQPQEPRVREHPGISQQVRELEHDPEQDRVDQHDRETERSQDEPAEQREQHGPDAPVDDREQQARGEEVRDGQQRDVVVAAVRIHTRQSQHRQQREADHERDDVDQHLDEHRAQQTVRVREQQHDGPDQERDPVHDREDRRHGLVRAPRRVDALVDGLGDRGHGEDEQHDRPQPDRPSGLAEPSQHPPPRSTRYGTIVTRAIERGQSGAASAPRALPIRGACLGHRAEGGRHDRGPGTDAGRDEPRPSARRAHPTRCRSPRGSGAVEARALAVRAHRPPSRAPGAGEGAPASVPSHAPRRSPGWGRPVPASGPSTPAGTTSRAGSPGAGCPSGRRRSEPPARTHPPRGP